ncbi:metallophosphoesterase family protein [Inediibacterium massiliense]|uniref:metallophosphoesterase family protein n=1 Tax=Inediibacterium massiliense TaxID=1658111 RepID=UPI0006B66002|nr:metallophosphoesterase family protein [Inediibacterium massiliense]
MKEKRVAIISDINANRYVLESFLNYIHNKDIDHIINLGNFLKNGPHPQEVIEMITTDKRFINLLGADEYDLFYNENKEEPCLYENWMKDRCKNEILEKIKTFPVSLPLEMFGQKVLLMTHDLGEDSLGHEHWNIRALILKSNIVRKIDITNILEYDYIFCGRKGVQELKVENFSSDHPVTILCPGNLSCLRDNLMTFAMLVFKENEGEVSFKKISYDINQVFRDLYDLDVPDKESIINEIYKVQNVETLLDEDNYLKKYAKQEGDVVIYTNHSEDHMDRKYKEFWDKILMYMIPTCRYVEFGCWKNDTFIMTELEEIAHIISIEKYGCEQMSITCMINEDIMELLAKDFITENGSFKWFELTLLKEMDNEDDEDDDSLILNTRHFGTEYCLYHLTKEQTKYIKSLCNQYGLKYNIF